ncbi:hypothetical protein NQ166_03070 [Microbacterium sp. zg.Y1090]|uniref:hypothetical protein n=1 Tax=Microbacterium TaxID=33882 RepID=UPI00214B8413|nr:MULTISPECIES: hypothetical protein [unclassified Microbacterium]MCR2812390.1 hypothetical protein [Microbacterium sp. zg.Y1084]MCR2817809.1 hypothetical protein [Microbacterium sp. zg.Y1090]MDL5485547.1 hypothetical protein [Microbacterium sp. zg-Y1211]WIM28718.1 hypothetical protein QNO26_02145 [Microbacterium sp. zg-Y1090]
MDHSTRRVRVEPMGHNAWRLLDKAADNAAQALLAYVELTVEGPYEAVWVAARTGTSRHETLEEVVRVAHDLFSPPAVSRRTKPIPIAHHPPLSPSQQSVN